MPSRRRVHIDAHPLEAVQEDPVAEQSIPRRQAGEARDVPERVPGLGRGTREILNGWQAKGEVPGNKAPRIWAVQLGLGRARASMQAGVKP